MKGNKVKKFLICAAAGAVLVLPASAGVAAGPAVWGDVNCSGSVNAADVVNVRRAAVGLPIIKPVGCETPADVNCSGTVNAADMVLIRQMSVGIYGNLPVGCNPPAGYVLG